MKKGIPLEGEFDPQTATFWAKFQTEHGGAQERHTNCRSVYSAPSGKFFIVNMPPDGPARKHGQAGGQMPTRYDLIENEAELEDFLNEMCNLILQHYG